MPNSLLALLSTALESLPDPRSKQGVSHPYHGMLALVLLGLIAQLPSVAQIRRWAKRNWHTLKGPLNFKRKKPPVDTTLFRALEKTTVADLHKAFAEFLQVILAEDNGTITAAVDGKVAKQMKDADGDPILMLNIFAHNVKVALLNYDRLTRVAFLYHQSEVGRSVARRTLAKDPRSLAGGEQSPLDEESVLGGGQALHQVVGQGLYYSDEHGGIVVVLDAKFGRFDSRDCRGGAI